MLENWHGTAKGSGQLLVEEGDGGRGRDIAAPNDTDKFQNSATLYGIEQDIEASPGSKFRPQNSQTAKIHSPEEVIEKKI